MKKLMIRTTLLLTVIFISLFTANSYEPSSFLGTMLITTGTILYHFAMRLSIGTAIDKALKNNIDIDRSYFQIKPVERKLYAALHVKTWKSHIPTYDPALFDIEKHSLSEIAKASAQAEIIHTVIAVLSLLPVIASVWLSAFWVFLMTSIIAALIDLSSVMVQRFNRDRIYNLIKHQKS